MIILEILLFIALIAVIFGVSMHDAFWGIVSFIVVAILAAIAWLFLKALATRINNKVTYIKSPAGKEAQKKKLKNTLEGFLIGFTALVIFNPLVSFMIIYLAFPQFATEHEGIAFFIAAGPLLVLLGILFISWLTSPKKRAPKKTR